MKRVGYVGQILENIWLADRLKRKNFWFENFQIDCYS